VTTVYRTSLANGGMQRYPGSLLAYTSPACYPCLQNTEDLAVIETPRWG
jgi:hypothetical protein